MILKWIAALNKPKNIISFLAGALALLLITPTGSATALAGRGEMRTPIFMYHSLSGNGGGKWTLMPDEFEEDLKYLYENGYESVFMSELVDYVNGDGEAFPEKPVVLTFDDGYYNNLTRALPLLEKYYMKMTLSVIGRPSELFSRVEDINEEYGHLNWDQLEEMVESGRVELANHTWDMHSQDGREGCCRKSGESLESYKIAFMEDVGRMQDELERISGKPPVCFTYPFGSRSSDTLGILKEMGFKATLTCYEGVNKIVQGDPNCLYELKRVNRAPGRSVKTFLESRDYASAFRP